MGNRPVRVSDTLEMPAVRPELPHRYCGFFTMWISCCATIGIVLGVFSVPAPGADMRDTTHLVVTHPNPEPNSPPGVPQK
jgi:hypothetical protein